MTMAGGLTLDDKMESRGHIAICMFCRMTCLAIFIMRVIVSGLPLEVLVVFVSKFWKRKLNKFCNIKVYRFSFFFIHILNCICFIGTRFLNLSKPSVD